LIATSDPGCRFWRSNKHVDLFRRKIFDRLPLVPLAWNGKHAAAQLSATWLMERNVPEKGMDGCQACVPRPGTVRALVLDVIQKLANKGSVQIF
jgi:hypothetical protein